MLIKEIVNKIGISFDKIYFYASYTPKKNRLTQREKKYIISEFNFYKGVKKLKIDFGNIKIKFHKKQEIEVIKLNKKNVGESIKNPGVL